VCYNCKEVDIEASGLHLNCRYEMIQRTRGQGTEMVSVSGGLGFVLGFIILRCSLLTHPAEYEDNVFIPLTCNYNYMFYNSNND